MVESILNVLVKYVTIVAQKSEGEKWKNTIVRIIK